ncbi:MAG: acyltransferase [Anaerolineae bacterium]|nr:acyltransferase [Anaerolineae bacterium]
MTTRPLDTASFVTTASTIAAPVDSHTRIQTKTYFKGLNALRFYAALSVVVQHIIHSPTDWYHVALPETLITRFFLMGADAVNLFFVLSGFLITYLLMMERQRTGTISIRKFYGRRILRIWPLYFTILALVAFIIPLLVPNFDNPLHNVNLLMMLVFFLGNVGYVFFYPFPPLEHLWSIAVEEQFYLIIPVLMKLRQNVVPVFVSVIIVFWGLQLIVSSLPLVLGNIILTMRYDCMALGGLFAYAYFHRLPILQTLSHRLTVTAALIVVGLTIAFRWEIYSHSPIAIYNIVTSLAYAVLIVNVALREHVANALGQPMLEQLGNISYGIYMYHPLLLFVFFKTTYAILPSEVYQMLMYPVIIGSTIALAWLSYRHMETPFLKMRDRLKVAR